MPGPKERQDGAPERDEEERAPQSAPADIERDAPERPADDLDQARQRESTERRPHRDVP